ncbi:MULTISPECIES: helix-turn-helix transcriptional regulator [unclassified Streptomyces]|uniref:helix-turn-helix domain-containing protein n=2 Tax=unclassified Streptomyces TaxID=2593676 RepID=UPI000A49F72A|nr:MULTISPECIES: helix-turn-helix transcriptional regulator [unclassified Streptomyces]
MSESMPAAEFAALLRELKDRSGLSYGVLAKRLHMSTSTLHRYCNGDAVPTDYAPVERLARLCKAGPEELVELHRRWVLADAVRRRKPETPAADAPEKVTRTPEQDTAPAVTGGPGRTTGPAAAEAPDRSTAPAPAPAEAPEQSTGRPTEEASDGPRPRLRTRTAVVAGTAVAAVVVGITLALGLPDGGTDGDAAKKPVGAATVDDKDVTPTPSLSASSSASASASPSQTPAPADKKTSSPPAPGAAVADTDDEDSGVPLTVHTEPYAWESPCFQRYLVNRPASEVKPPPVQQDAPAWVSAFGAVSSGEQYVKLTVQGTSDRTVVVEDLTVRVAGKRSPLAWNDFVMGHPGVGCGAGVPTRSFTVALDAARPDVTPQAGHDDFPFSVSQSDPEVYYITADASAYDVSWYLELKWSSGSRSGTLTVDDKGRPFRTSGNNGRPAYEFPLGGEKWVPEGTTLQE